jgi:hypothetical protein
LKAHGFCIDDDTVQLFRERSPCISVIHHFRERVLGLRSVMRVVHLLKGHEDFVGAWNIHIGQNLECLFQNCETSAEKGSWVAT